MPDVSVRTVQLEKIKIGLEMAASEFLLEPRAVALDAGDFFSRHVRMGVRGYLWGKTIESHTIRYPHDWWEAVKERWAPAWFCRRWPVRYKEHQIDLKAVWPTIRHLVPDHTPKLILHDFGVPIGRYEVLDEGKEIS